MDKKVETYLTKCKESGAKLFNFLQETVEDDNVFEELSDIVDYIECEFTDVNPEDLLDVLQSWEYIIYKSPNYVINKDAITLDGCITISVIVSGLVSLRALLGIRDGINELNIFI